MYFIVLCVIAFSSLCRGLSGNPKIAIIGGGIGGTSCAYYLRQLFGDKVSLTLFEREAIGGRLATIAVGREEYESGGSVIHPRNKYLLDFAKLLGLQRRKGHYGIWGIYDGQEFVFQTSPWSVVTMYRLYWRYGWSPFELQSMIKSLLDDFSKIYDAQDRGLAFTSVLNLLNYMNSNFPNMTQQTLTSFLTERGFSDNFIKELAQAVMLVNYGQTTSINAFVGSVSLAGSESGLWSIKGGNKQVPSGLLEKSKAKLIYADVASVLLKIDGSFQLAYKLQNTDTMVVKDFDVVVIAAPLIRNANNIKFLNFTKDMTKSEGVYHRTVSTFVDGRINDGLFQVTPMPDVIFTNNDSFIFSSLGVSFPVSDNDVSSFKKVYKIFTKVPISQSQLKGLFKEFGTVTYKDWLAYPQYQVPEKLPSFMPYPGLYYVNAIEWAASAMEMSAIAGRNVALLIHNTWTDRVDLVDTLNEVYKDEL